LQKEVGLVGAKIKEALDAQIEWRIRFPEKTKEECHAWLLSKYGVI
jgi:hypothetical protein